LLDADRKKIEALGRPAASVLRVFHYAQTHPILSIVQTAGKTGSTFPTVAAAIDHMQRLGILHEITGRQRHRLFAYRGYMDILNEGTEPLR
jgi:Fic family protein